MKQLSCVLALVFLCSCASVEEYPLEREVSKHRGKAPLPLRTALLAVEVPFAKKSSVPEAYDVPLDGEKVQKGYLTFLSRYPVFQKLVAYPSLPREKALQKAWEENVDLLMELRVKRYHLSYVGVSTWRYLLSLVLWGYLWFPSWWVADEIYQGDLQMQLRFISVHSGKAYPPEEESQKYTFRAQKSFFLDDWDRGWKLFGIFTVPSYLSKSNWENVRLSLAPYLEKKVQADLWKRLQGDFRKFYHSPQYAEWSRKTLALVVGISSYRDTQIRSIVNFSKMDAQEMGRFFSSRIRQTITLMDEQASRRAIWQKLQYVLSKAKPYDTVFFYFAGYGATLRREGRVQFYLIPYDASLNQLPEESLPLEEVLALCRSSQAKQIWVILDTSLGGSLTESSLTGRALTYEWNREYLRPRMLPEIRAEDIQKAWQELSKSVPPNTALLLATRPNQDAQEVQEARRGLFSIYLLRKLTGVKEQVSLESLVPFLKRTVNLQARKRYGLPQQVELLLGRELRGQKNFWRFGETPLKKR